MAKTKTKLEKQIADGIRDGSGQRWGPLDDLTRLYGITRSAAYHLIAEGKIKSRLVRFKHSRGTGRRFIDLRSVEAFLDACPITPTKGVSRRMRNAALRSVAVRAAFSGNGRRKRNLTASSGTTRRKNPPCVSAMTHGGRSIRAMYATSKVLKQESRA